MTAIGYTMMCEQAAPDQLVRDVRSAELAGFDFSVISGTRRAMTERRKEIYRFPNLRVTIDD